jgi:hypothetical protein
MNHVAKEVCKDDLVSIDDVYLLIRQSVRGLDSNSELDSHILDLLKFNMKGNKSLHPFFRISFN